MSLPDFARLQYITTYMHESCKIISVVAGRHTYISAKETWALLWLSSLGEITIRVTIRQSNTQLDR